MDKISTELEPCPFCGCTDISVDDNGHDEWLKCDWCGATGGVDPAPELEGKSLAWHWNRRASRTSPEPGEWQTVPQKMRMEGGAAKAIAFMLGSADADDDTPLDAILWVGDLEGDDGKPVHGLHLANAEYPEEGSITLVEFAALRAASIPTQMTGLNLTPERRKAASEYTGPISLTQPGVRIKPLEWGHSVIGEGTVLRQNSWRAGEYLIVESPAGNYDLRGPRYAICGTLDEAKAAAQADYERRIRSAIDPAEQPVGYVSQTTLAHLKTKTASVACHIYGAPVSIHNQALYASPASPEAEKVTDAARDVLAERQRQVHAEGWTPEHDDQHNPGQMAVAAACYAANGLTANINRLLVWLWAPEWWKPTTRRRDLVKAGALILAEIERLDRAALKAGE